jgi:hypothetical protein
MTVAWPVFDSDLSACKCSACRKARTFDARKGEWNEEPPPVAFFSCVWLVCGAVKPRAMQDEHRFCCSTALERLQQEIEEQLQRKLLLPSGTMHPLVSVEKVIETSGFFSRMGWEQAGMPADDPEIRELLVGYVHVMLEELEASRSRRGRVHRGTVEASKADVYARRLARKLSDDMDFLCREACKCYVAEHHPVAAKVLGWTA